MVSETLKNLISEVINLRENYLYEEEFIAKELNSNYAVQPKDHLYLSLINRTISREARYEVLKRQRWRCNFCHKTLKMSKYSDWAGETAHIDHIHPYSKRDSYVNGVQNINELSNLQALCPECNLKKGKKEVN